MKKIKYLLGLFIVGIGLLINQSFGLVVEGVTLPLTSSSYSSSSCYKYNFNYSQTTLNGTATPYARFFGYYSYYNGIRQVNYSTQTFNNTNYSCPALYTTIQLNNSVFGQDLYTGSCINGGGNSWRLNYGSNMPKLSWGGSFNSLQRVVIGNGQNFGNTFVYVGTLTEPNPSPKYGFGGGFMLNNDWVELNDNTLNGSPLRLFFNQNVNLSSPLDGFDIASNSGDNITGSIARQYFTQNGFRYQTYNQTTPKTFGDFGGSYRKGRHFGGYGMGYSFAIDTLSQGFIRWDDFSFVTVGSRCIENLMTLGLSDPNSGTSSGCQQIGLLALKGDSYVSRSNNASVIILSKNPSNKSQILYEQFDCAEDDIQRVFNSSYCSSIGHGYITYNGSSEILPFNNVGVYYFGSGNLFLDYLLNGNFYGNISINGNNYCLNSDSSNFCFGLTSTPRDKSIKELYLDGLIGGVPSISNPEDITDQMIANCKGPFYNTPDGLPPAYCNNLGINFTGNCYTDIGVDSSGNLYQSLICVDGNDYINNTNTWVVDENGNYISYCSGDCDGRYIYYGKLEHSFDSTGYFDNYFTSTGNFFKCPYSYTQRVVVGKKLINLINYDPFVPINCFIASYLAGKNSVLFSGGLNSIDGGPLLKSTSNTSVLLFHFFDFLLCIGLILFASKLDKIFSK